MEEVVAPDNDGRGGKGGGGGVVAAAVGGHHLLEDARPLLKGDQERRVPAINKRGSVRCMSIRELT